MLISENDSGKTAIIDAIKIVLKTHAYEWIKIEHDDFFDNSNKFRIEILFEELNDTVKEKSFNKSKNKLLYY